MDWGHRQQWTYYRPISVCDFYQRLSYADCANSDSQQCLKDFGLLCGINFPRIRDSRIGILIVADAFTATVQIKYTVGPPETPYGVLTQLGWTITRTFPNKYGQITEENHCNRNKTLLNRVYSEKMTLDEDMLQLFWTCEAASTTKTSLNTINKEHKKALQIFEDTVKHNGEKYGTGLHCKQNI